MITELKTLRMNMAAVMAVIRTTIDITMMVSAVLVVLVKLYVGELFLIFFVILKAHLQLSQLFLVLDNTIPDSVIFIIVTFELVQLMLARSAALRLQRAAFVLFSYHL